jgi:DNA-binding NarL/FixJ family response regulator
VHSGARGAVLRAADATALARAFDAVVASELWLPRQVMQWLYATMVDAPAAEHAPSAPSSSWSADSELTPRENEVAALMRQGLTNREIGERLGVSINTVKKHLASAYEKHGLRSRRQTLL